MSWQNHQTSWYIYHGFYNILYACHYSLDICTVSPFSLHKLMFLVRYIIGFLAYKTLYIINLL